MATFVIKHPKWDQNPAFEAAFSCWMSPTNIRHLRPFYSRLNHVKLVFLWISDASTQYLTTEVICIEEIFARMFFVSIYHTVNSAFRAFWFASSEVISQVLFASEQTEKTQNGFPFRFWGANFMDKRGGCFKKYKNNNEILVDIYFVRLLLITWLIMWLYARERASRAKIYIHVLLCAFVAVLLEINKFWISWLFSLCGIY